MKIYKVLFVEDDQNISEMVCLSFPKNQFTVKPAFDGREALALVKKDRPDIILLDVMMPVMDGWETLLKLKSVSTTKDIPVMMCTSKDSMADVEKSFNFGAQGYVIKPIDIDKLLRKIRAILKIDLPN